MSGAQLESANPTAASQSIFTNDRRVACDGGGGVLGHPQVWLTLVGDGQVICPYCSRHFVFAPHASENS